MTEFINLRHYIFINPNNLTGNIQEDPVLIENKKIHSEYYTDETIKYHSYNDIAELAKKYDTQLYELYCKLNPIYPALLADIGRFLILYNYGGVYHDLKCVDTPQMKTYLQELVTKNIIFVAETHPTETHRVRNTNIISLCKYHPFLKHVLDNITLKLLELQNTNCKGPRLVALIGSGIYINSFNAFKNNNTISDILLRKCIFMIPKLYKLRISAWQRTEAYLFKI